MKRDNALQIAGELHTVLRDSARKGVPVGVVGMPEVIDARKQRSEGLAIARDSAGGHAAKARTVVTPLNGRSTEPWTLVREPDDKQGLF